MTHEEYIEYYYNKGEQDGANGIFDPPYGIILSGTDFTQECGEAYDAGYANAVQQAQENSDG